MSTQSIMTDIQMLQRKRTDSRKWSNLIMADIKFLYVSEIFKFAQCGQRVERQNQNLNIFESADETQTFDFEIRKISKL